MDAGEPEIGAIMLFTAMDGSEMPGFGEQMRQISLHFVPTAILSRQVGVIRKQALILNLLAGFPCQPFSLAGVSKKNSLGRAHGFPFFLHPVHHIKSLNLH